MPRKGENIYKRKDGRWEGRYIKARSNLGKTSYGYVYAKTYREAKAKLKEAAMLGSKSEANLRNTNSDLFECAATEWFEATKLLVKESTSNKYWNLLKLYILPEIGNLPINCITHDVIESYCNLLLLSGGVKKSGLSAKTVSDALSVVRSILRYSAKKGTVISSDIHSIQVRQHQKEMRVLSRSEQEKLCQYLYSDLNACNIGILMCLFTGLRVGEICALRWEDISLADQTIHVHQTMQRVQDRSQTGNKTKVIVTTPKSACSIRTIPIPDELVDIISARRITGAGYFLTNSSHKILEPRTIQIVRSLLCPVKKLYLLRVAPLSRLLTAVHINCLPKITRSFPVCGMCSPVVLAPSTVSCTLCARLTAWKSSGEPIRLFRYVTLL